MPEGPSLVILRQLIEELHLVGKEILEISGTTDLEKKRMLHKKIVKFKTWGKHFLICFSGFTLRIHLMMFGTYRINSHKDVKPKIGFKFKDAEINFYTCDLIFIEGNLSDTYDWKSDILSNQWEEKSALKKLKEHPETLICDQLLNQTIFAGSGNIIKNEALYRSKVDPKHRVADLTTAKLKSLVKNVRDYAFDFLKWKKENTLSKHWDVYSKKICPKGHTITKEAIGKNKRVTYYCKHCQK